MCNTDGYLSVDEILKSVNQMEKFKGGRYRGGQIVCYTVPRVFPSLSSPSALLGLSLYVAKYIFSGHNMYDSNGDRRIDYKEFLKWLTGKDNWAWGAHTASTSIYVSPLVLGSRSSVLKYCITRIFYKIRERKNSVGVALGVGSD